MNSIILYFHENEKLARELSGRLKIEAGEINLRDFPDGETYLRLNNRVQNKEVIVICSLNNPNEKLLPLYFLCNLLDDAGADSITLVAPYLAYLRQDKIFNPGEALTSVYFASLLSQFIDKLVTVDPHLHRYSNLQEIYHIPTYVVQSAGLIADWILRSVERPLLIGPDSESKQWVSQVARMAGAPYITLEKTRFGDRDVEISLPELDNFQNVTPVLIDDIISTGKTMIRTIDLLKEKGLKSPVCIVAHPLFTGNSYEEIEKAGASAIISCDTIPHHSNQLNTSDLIASVLSHLSS